MSTRWAYAAPAFALAFVGVPIYVYLPPFYTDVVGVDIALVGFCMLGSRVFDAVTDPVIGVVSDRTRTRFGRRRPFIIGASLPLALTIYFLLNPPTSLDASAAGMWFGAWMRKRRSTSRVSSGVNSLGCKTSARKHTASSVQSVSYFCFGA